MPSVTPMQAAVAAEGCPAAVGIDGSTSLVGVAHVASVVRVSILLRPPLWFGTPSSHRINRVSFTAIHGISSRT